MNGPLSIATIVAALVLAAWFLLRAALNRAPGRPELIATALLGALVAVLVLVAVAGLFADTRPADTATFAGLVYLAATVGLAIGGTRGRLIALVSCSIELLGVLIVGTLSIADAVAFPDDTVWSHYGSGYGYVPLLLPFGGLWWIWRHRPRPEPDES